MMYLTHAKDHSTSYCNTRQRVFWSNSRKVIEPVNGAGTS